MKYGISTIVLAQTELQAALRRIAEAGFDQIEIVAEPPHFGPGDYPPKQVRAWLDEFGLKAPVAHGIYSYDKPDCSSPDEARRRASVENITRCFEPLAALGVQYVVLHPTGNYSPEAYTPDTRPARIRQARKSIEELAERAGPMRLRLAWENLPNYGGPRPLNSMADLRPLIEDLPAHVGLCVDTTHAKIAGHNPAEQMRIAGNRLFCLHLHDCDGKRDCHWVPGKGIIDWPAVLQALDEIKFRGPRTIEVISTDEDSDAVLADAHRVAREWEQGRR